MPGLFFVEARRRIERGAGSLERLHDELTAHGRRVDAARTHVDEHKAEKSWIDVLEGVGSLEPLFGRTIREFSVADFLLVAAAEAFVNAVAAHVLPPAELENFEKLSPTGKWLFLPRIMKLKWKPKLDKGCLQQFASLVARRNRVVHPRVVRVKNTVEVGRFVDQLKLEAESANRGVECVRELIREISLSWRGGYGPDWLYGDSARKRPPCFVLGSIDAPARLGRRSSKRSRTEQA